MPHDILNVLREHGLRAHKVQEHAARVSQEKEELQAKLEATRKDLAEAKVCCQASGCAECGGSCHEHRFQSPMCADMLYSFRINFQARHFGPVAYPLVC